MIDSTKELGECVQAIERNQSIDVTPVRQRLHSHDGDPPNAFMLQAASTGHQNRIHGQDAIPQPSALQGNADIPQPSQTRDLDRDFIIPGVDVLHRNPTFSGGMQHAHFI